MTVKKINVNGSLVDISSFDESSEFETKYLINSEDYTEIKIDNDDRLIESIDKLGNKTIYGDLTVYGNISNQSITTLFDKIENIGDKEVEINLPNRIVAVVGDTLQVFFRGIIKLIDPYKYSIRVICNKGNLYPRYFEYTPIKDDIGTYTFTVQVRNDSLKILGEKNCKLVVVDTPKSPSENINVACFGDSLTSSGVWCEEACRRLIGNGGAPSAKNLQNITFVGSKHNNLANYYGVGGWTWDSYTTKGRAAFRFYVSQTYTLTSGAVYTNNGYQYTIIENNSQNGNILCSVASTSYTPSENGVLTKVSGNGDNEISFSSNSVDSLNPLWDTENNKMTFIPYVNKYCNGQLDVVYTLLTWNGISSINTNVNGIVTQARKFADTLHTEYPNAKLKILGILVPSINGGMGANYGATASGYADTYGNVCVVFMLNEAYQNFANENEYKSFVEFVNVSSQFDSENNMPETLVKVNTRSSKEEYRGTNGVHPSTQGYNQIADVVYRNMVANFCQ